MSDIYPITLARYNDWEKAGLVDENQIYQIYDTDEDIAKELIRTRKALDVAKDKLDTVRQYHRGTAVVRPDDMAAYCDRAIEQITALEQKDK